jgi:hypothetical protein
VPFQYFRGFFPHFPQLKHIRIISEATIPAEWDIAAKAPTITGVAMRQEGNRIRLNWTGRADKGSRQPSGTACALALADKSGGHLRRP